MKYLSADELKNLSPADAARYCDLVRKELCRTVSVTGGHLASNLGIVEISVALLRGLDLPEEKVVYDTGHQCYVHKMLTGRGEKFSTLRSLGGISGFPRREESEFDAFGTGHSGTGISAALGFAKANRLEGKSAFSVAVIGDGSFTGGMVFEALNNISPGDRVIIILNDNGMSISQSVGALKGALNRMRTRDYYKFKDGLQTALESIPLVGDGLARFAKGAKNAVKKSALPMGNLFEQYGLHYFGPADGNDLSTVEFLLHEAKKKHGPSIIHLSTKKGKGLPEAERDPGRFHGLSPAAGEKKSGVSFSEAFGNAMRRIAREDKDVVAITAAMTDGVGLRKFQEEFPARLFDVGIAEEHGATFAAALAAAGKKPVFALYSTFFQRAYDQMLHDAALQGLPVVFCLDRAGITGEDGSTHHGLFDVAMTLPVPGVKILCPMTEKELESALRRALSETKCPTVIRYPKGRIPEEITAFFPCEGDVEYYDFGEGEPQLTVATYGSETVPCIRAARRLGEKGIPVRVVRFAALKGFDEGLLSVFSLKTPLLVAEEGMKTGGFGQSLLLRLTESDALTPKKAKLLAIDETFVPHGRADELIRLFGLGEENVEKELILLAET